MNDTATFDVLAKQYDETFTASVTGRHQRNITRRWLSEFLKGKGAMKILEINCGTGEDACWLASLGHDVTATDASASMIAVAEAKGNGPDFHVVDFASVPAVFNHQKFDLVFSNFAGLNCLSPGQLSHFMEQLRAMLHPNGHLAFVVFGKYCLWEQFYFLLKGSPGKAFRRQKSALNVPLNKNVIQKVYYFPLNTFRKQSGYSLKDRRPVGFWIPPTYLEGFLRKRPKLSKLLVRMENRFLFRWMTPFADHSYLLLKKNA